MQDPRPVPTVPPTPADVLTAGDWIHSRAELLAACEADGTLNPHLAELKESIGLIAQAFHSDPTWAYRSPAAFVLEEGTPYHMQSRPADSTIRFPRSAPRECFVNVAHLVYVVPGLEYVEGYGAVHGVPFLHAWAEGRHGEVYDPTIDWSAAGDINPLMLGVRIPRALVTAKVNADGWLPFIDDYRHGWPLLADRWSPRDVAFIRRLARAYRRQAELDGPRAGRA